MSIEEKPLHRVMTRDGPSVHVGHRRAVTGDEQEQFDELEREASVMGVADTLGHALSLMGFADWPDVERCARDHGHQLAIELLCRHRQRSAGQRQCDYARQGGPCVRNPTVATADWCGPCKAAWDVLVYGQRSESPDLDRDGPGGKD